MAKRVAYSELSGSTLDILNVIRANASLEYQSAIPTITSEKDIPKVGEIIYGTPALANQFLNALINRIAMVVIKSATFNNPYSRLKKGYLEFGETVEDIFVGIASVVEYTPEKGAEREYKRTMPDVRSAFHIMNWRVVYPVTIQDDDLYQAFLSVDGVTSLIARIVEQIYTAAEYDEFLLFKYMLIKAISHGKMYPAAIDMSRDANAAIAFRGMSNLIPFMKDKYNEAGVLTTTPKERQAIFMDSFYNAQYDVNVLASAFNMDKADFMGRLHLIDDWTTFDNKRFEVIRANSDGIEEVTAAELALLSKVKAVLIDEEWFQIYDNKNKMTEKYNASGLYWNYFYHTWKTVSASPFSNAIVFVSSDATITNPSTLTATVASVDEGSVARIVTLNVDASSTGSLQPNNVEFIQTEDMVEELVAVQKYGVYIYPMPASGHTTSSFYIEAKIGDTVYSSKNTSESPKLNLSSCDVGDTIVLTPAS